jgi:hypothetical protein
VVRATVVAAAGVPGITAVAVAGTSSRFLVGRIPFFRAVLRRLRLTKGPSSAVEKAIVQKYVR